jgi:Fic family protein
MNTLRRFSPADTTVPAGTSWYLADIGEARGMQELFTRQAPQRLKALREHALIESAVSSNRIEGVIVEPRRVRELILGQPLLRDRDEEELRGYRNALTLIHQGTTGLEVSDATIRELHRMTRGEIWDAGLYKEKDIDIIERLACPGVSRDMVRRVLRDRQAAGLVACQGRGPAARWRRKG